MTVAGLRINALSDSPRRQNPSRYLAPGRTPPRVLRCLTCLRRFACHLSAMPRREPPVIRPTGYTFAGRTDLVENADCVLAPRRWEFTGLGDAIDSFISLELPATLCTTYALPADEAGIWTLIALEAAPDLLALRAAPVLVGQAR